MILLGIGVLIVLIAISYWLYWSKDVEFAEGVYAVSVILLFIEVIVAALLTVTVANLSVIDDRIAMYQEENSKIEQQIADIVEQYQKYETDIFMDVAPDTAVTLVTLYPELKSDILVQSQIEVYTENNKMIKSLRDQQIKGDVSRWWLYFGGKS
jgi:hypothetical protein|nr:MAG TPA: hypothetical protein [Caudoviricetes sp.]